MKYILLSLLFIIPFCSNAKSCHSLTTINWLLGSWVATDKEQTITESWHQVSATTIEGNGETFVMGKLKSSESLRIVEMSGALFYIAKVNHNPLPIAFKLTNCSVENAIFENTEHDFPKRIEYKSINKDKMMVIVSVGKSKSFSIDFIRAKAN